MNTLHFVAANAHAVQVGEQRVLFHIPTSALYDFDEVGAAVYDLFADRGALTAEDLQQQLQDRFDPAAVTASVQDFLDLQLLSPNRDAPPASPPIRIEEYPLSTIVLNVNTGCNLSCSYCYKEDLQVPVRGEKMTLDTARRSIELLLAEGANRDRINVVFFGGEPLSHISLIRQVVDYAEARCAAENKTVDFSLTTNATLLTDEMIEYFDRHRFGLSISIDGPKAIHDRHRRTVGGQGSYDVVAGKLKRLLERYRSRPIGARVTITAGELDVVAIHEHLIDELGFFEAGYAPVTANAEARFNLDGAELKQLFANMKVLGQRYLKAALAGRNIGFSNLHQLLSDLHQGNRKKLPCGAGLGLLAVDHAGDLNLCHRFTGSNLPTYGNVHHGGGIAKKRLGAFLEQATERSGTVCENCRIRHLCAGGCYHESYAHFADPLSPTYQYCDLLRDWVDFGISIYRQILAANPDFFARHISPRSLSHETINLN